MPSLQRCAWSGDDPLYVEYHDTEWGVPVHDDRKLFEFLILEGMQAGLSWLTILRKRENFRRAFAGFDPEKVARFGKRDVARLMADAGIVRNEMKILAAVANAEALLESSLDIVIAVDRKGQIIFYNDGAYKTLGYTSAEILGKQVTTVYPSLDEARAVKAAMRSGEFGGERGKVKNFETVLVAKSGERIPAAISGSLIFLLPPRRTVRRRLQLHRPPEAGILRSGLRCLRRGPGFPGCSWSPSAWESAFA